jgi:hypothetical protein
MSMLAWPNLLGRSAANAWPADRILSAVGGSAMLGGALLDAMALVLPWISIEGYFTRGSYSLPLLVSLATSFDQPGTAIFYLGLTVMVGVGGLAGAAAGITCLVAGRSWTVATGCAGAMAAVLVLMATSIFLAVVIVDRSGAAPTVGVAAALAAGLLIFAGSGAVLVGRFVR